MDWPTSRIESVRPDFIWQVLGVSIDLQHLTDLHLCEVRICQEMYRPKLANEKHLRLPGRKSRGNSTVIGGHVYRSRARLECGSWRFCWLEKR